MNGSDSISPTVPPISTMQMSAPSGAAQDALLDFVGDMRNDLYGGAQVVAAPFLGDHLAVDAPGGEIAVAAGLAADETLVMPKIQVRLGAVLGNEHLAVLEGAHGARVHVDVGIQLDHAHVQAAGFENGAEGCRGDALAERRDHASGDENESRHCPPWLAT